MGSDVRTQTDVDLWQAVVAGDGEAFAAVFDRHGDRVLTQVARRIGSRQDADELASEVFVQAWRSRDKARFVDGSLLPWLLVIANHVAWKHLRSASRYVSMRRRLPAEPSLEPDPADNAISNLELAERARALARALAALSRADQQLIALCDLGELTYAQAAAALDIPIGTVRSRLSRAHQRLRTILIQPASESRARPQPGGHHE